MFTHGLMVLCLNGEKLMMTLAKSFNKADNGIFLGSIAVLGTAGHSWVQGNLRILKPWLRVSTTLISALEALMICHRPCVVSPVPPTHLPPVPAPEGRASRPQEIESNITDLNYIHANSSHFCRGKERYAEQKTVIEEFRLQAILFISAFSL